MDAPELDRQAGVLYMARLMAKTDQMQRNSKDMLGNQVLVLASVVIAIAMAPGPSTIAGAQGLDNPEAIDSIVGSDVHEDEQEAAAETDRLIAAIEKSGENISNVRKINNLDKVDIVFLPDAAQTEGGPPPEIEQKLEEHAEEIEQMRQELEGNAMLYHAIDSRQILIRDILALEFDDENGVVIYAAAKPAS